MKLQDDNNVTLACSVKTIVVLFILLHLWTKYQLTFDWKASHRLKIYRRIKIFNTIIIVSATAALSVNKVFTQSNHMTTSEECRSVQRKKSLSTSFWLRLMINFQRCKILQLPILHNKQHPPKIDGTIPSTV